MELTGRVALITGGKRIGAVVAEELAKRGVDVALAYSRSLEEAEAAAATVRAHGRLAAGSAAEPCRTLRVPQARDRRGRALGRLDILVNMASVYRQRPFGELTCGRLERHR